MREYFNRLEKITDASAAAALASPQPNTRGATMITALARAYDAPTVAALHGLLDQAQQAAALDASIARRIAFLRRGLQLADVQAQAFRLQDENDAATLRARRAEVLAFMTKRYGVMRDIVENDVLAVSIPYLLWGGEGNFRALQSPQSWKVLAGPEGVGSAVKAETKTVVDADENGMPEEQTALATP